MPPSPQVPCHPYFKLRRLTPHIQIGPLAPAPWTVPNLCAAYNWPTGLAGGGVIAIVELGGGWVQSDMDQYFKSINQPVPHITDISVDGTKNSPNQSTGSNSDPDYEVALDIEVAGAAYYAATGKPATIRIYWSRDIASAVQKAAKDGCDVCSISWGADEATWGTEAADEMESAAATATNLGMVVFAASGDNDSSDGGSTPANVDAPSSCPHVVGCGGTYKTSTVETVWNDSPGQTGGEGTGGGYSTIFPVQSWQIGVPAPPADSSFGKGRMVPESAPTPTPIPAITSSSTDHPRSSAEPAPWHPSTPASSPPSAGSLASSRPRSTRIRPTFTTSPAAATASTARGQGPTPVPASALPTAASSPACSPRAQPGTTQTRKLKDSQSFRHIP